MRVNKLLHISLFGLKEYSRKAVIRKCTTVSGEVKPFKSIPGLSSLPLIGPLHHFLPIIGSIGPQGDFSILTKILNEKYGNVVKIEGIYGRVPMVILFNPEDYDQVYRAEEANVLRPSFEVFLYYKNVLRKSTFDGVQSLTTAQGSQWRDFRTKVNPVFLKPKLVKLYYPALDKIAEDMVERLTKRMDDTEYLQYNFNEELTRYALESVAYIGLGDRLGCLRDDLTDTHPAKELMKCAKEIIDLAFKLDLMPSPWRYISTPKYKRLVDRLDKQWEISQMYIQAAKKRINERGHDIPEEYKSIIEKLLVIDEKVAIMMANEMLMAGIDTVASATLGLLYQLAANQNAQEKLREEIRSGTTNRRYLKASLKESLRIRAVVSANLRRTSKEHLVAGYRIPEGVEVIAPNEYLSNLDKHYTRAKEFLPERWLVEKSDSLHYGQTHPMTTLPFGFGVRTCIGKRFAELEIELLVARLIDSFKITWEGPPIKCIMKVINNYEKPFNFKFEKLK